MEKIGVVYQRIGEKVIRSAALPLYSPTTLLALRARHYRLHRQRLLFTVWRERAAKLQKLHHIGALFARRVVLTVALGRMQAIALASVRQRIATRYALHRPMAICWRDWMERFDLHRWRLAIAEDHLAKHRLAKAWQLLCRVFLYRKKMAAHGLMWSFAAHKARFLQQWTAALAKRRLDTVLLKKEEWMNSTLLVDHLLQRQRSILQSRLDQWRERSSLLSEQCKKGNQHARRLFLRKAFARLIHVRQVRQKKITALQQKWRRWQRFQYLTRWRRQLALRRAQSMYAAQRSQQLYHRLYFDKWFLRTLQSQKNDMRI